MHMYIYFLWGSVGKVMNTIIHHVKSTAHERPQTNLSHKLQAHDPHTHTEITSQNNVFHIKWNKAR